MNTLTPFIPWGRLPLELQRVHKTITGWPSECVPLPDQPDDVDAAWLASNWSVSQIDSMQKAITSKRVRAADMEGEFAPF